MPLLVRKFVVRFSRFEYALKRAGYVSAGHGGHDAQVNWSAFENRNDHAFCELVASHINDRLQLAIQSLRAEPPRKLVLLDLDGSRQLRWMSTAPNGLLLNECLAYVRRVRNNLFHGEKPETWVGDSHRGLELIGWSLAVLDACVSIEPEVERYSREYAPAIPRVDSATSGGSHRTSGD